jgi:hypothetical protein
MKLMAKSAPFLVAIVLVLPGCAPRESRDAGGARVEVNRPKTEQFVKKVDAVRRGTPMRVVSEQLGEPDDSRRGMIPANPEPGPTETLADLAPPGTPYNEWVYKRGDSHYHVFFTRGTRGGTTDWEVLTVRSTPAAAVE